MKKYQFYIIIGLGLFMRLIWTDDMEWKRDEKQLYSMAHEVVDKRSFPLVGMESGGGIVNPGMSVFMFSVIAAFTTDPLAMAKLVQIVNVISILFFLLFIYKKIDPGEKDTWFKGIVIASVSPLAILFSRKIWAQDLLPLFSFLIIFSNSYRNKGWGAFFWGFFGAMIGQVHMSGFFMALGLLLFTLVHDYFNKINFRWSYWLAGSLMGSIPMVPWIYLILHGSQTSPISIRHILQFNFYIFWFLDSLGLYIYYSLHNEFWLFIKEPFIFGKPTYLIAIAHLFLLASGILLLIRIIKYIAKIW